MKRISLFLSVAIIILIASCNGKSTETTQETTTEPVKEEVVEEKVADPKGVGEIKNVKLTDPLDEAMIVTGKSIYDMKCSSCHKLTDQRVVGPGWAGVTNRRRPEWIMNMITNVEVMLEEDPAAQKLLEECLTRMPNQSVSIEDSRAILEFMRKNDMDNGGKKDGAATN